jgi:hypothetical protein
MRFALKSIALICFFSLSLNLFAGSAPASTSDETEIVLPASKTDYSSNQLYSTNAEPVREGGMLILIAGIGLLFLSPLVLERVNKTA